jgi:hypothetical protein
MLSYSMFVEAWENRISRENPDKYVTSATKYDSPQHVMKNAKKIGDVGELELHSSETAGGGVTHFTYHPKTGQVHHVLYAAQKTQGKSGPELKFLSAHARKDSPVRMGQVYKSLIKDHGHTMVGTSHSPGAKKMWDRLRNDPELQLHGRHSDGTEKEIKPGEETHAPYGATDPNQKKLGKMNLVLKARK